MDCDLRGLELILTFQVSDVLYLIRKTSISSQFCGHMSSRKLEVINFKLILYLDYPASFFDFSVIQKSNFYDHEWIKSESDKNYSYGYRTKNKAK